MASSGFTERGSAGVHQQAHTIAVHVLGLLEDMIRQAQEGQPRRTLIEGLQGLDGVAGAWLGRPDTTGAIALEAVSDDNMRDYLHGVEIRADDSPVGQGPTGRSWRSGNVEFMDDWRQTPSTSPWRAAALRHGFRSSVSIPLLGHERPHEMLTVYSDRAGWFSRGLWPALITHIASVFGLVLEEWDMRRSLEQLARLDPLTELPNRRALVEHLGRTFASARREGDVFAAGIIDLDDFKAINDRFGHAAGDYLLQTVAQRLRDNVRANDFVARQGGDEFVLVFGGCGDLHNLDGLLARLHVALAKSVMLSSTEHVRVNASLGLAFSSPSEEAPDFSATELLRRADLALYQCKNDKKFRTNWWRSYTGDAPSAGMPAVDAETGQPAGCVIAGGQIQPPHSRSVQAGGDGSLGPRHPRRRG